MPIRVSVADCGKIYFLPRDGNSSTIPAMPRQSNKKKQPMNLKLRRRGEPDTPGTEPKNLQASLQLMLDIPKAASLYGSQGRAVQVGSEILVRMSKPPQVPQPDPDTIRHRTYKLAPRTIHVIELHLKPHMKTLDKCWQRAWKH